MDVLCSHSVIEHGLSSFSNNVRVSGPSDGGSRSTSGDTGKGELRIGSIEVRDCSKCYISRYCDVSWNSIIVLRSQVFMVIFYSCTAFVIIIT